MEHCCIFTTRSGASYLYDASTNSIHSWNAPLDEALAAAVYAASDEDLEEVLGAFVADERIRGRTLSYILAWRRNTGAFRNSAGGECPSLRSLEMAPTEKRGPVWMSDLVIVTAEACNLRCAYCSYSSFYEGYREHSTKLMDWPTARRGIDWFYHYNDDEVFKSYPDRNLNIVFYGGEPLLNFELVKTAVEYAEQTKKSHYGLVVSVSTNLTLLADEHLSFLRDHQIFVNVSLDGPPAEHDRYRRFADGRPTSETVLRNLRKVRLFDETYFFQKVRILPTFNGNSDVYASWRFFEANRAELPPFLMVNLLKDLSFSRFHATHPYDRARFSKSVAAVLEEYVERKQTGEKFHKGDFFFHFVEEALNNIFQRVHSYGVAHPSWLTGACLPGRKLAVAPDGAFHMCERINEHFPIGDIHTGLDPSKVTNIVNAYFSQAANCHTCWARNLCTICYATVCRGRGFEFPAHCEITRRNVQANLSLLYTVLENDRTALESKDEIISLPALPSP